MYIHGFVDGALTAVVLGMIVLVHRSTNNWTNHAECFSECAGQKT